MNQPYLMFQQSLKPLVIILRGPHTRNSNNFTIEICRMPTRKQNLKIKIVSSHLDCSPSNPNGTFYFN